MNNNNLINSTYKEKLTYQLWLKDYKKRHCKGCLIKVPAPESCYICYRERKTGFSCAKCLCFVYYSESKVCGGSYDTGSCFCAKCQGVIKKWLGKRKCVCEFSLAGYSTGHPIHNCRSTINGLVKPFFRGSYLWVKLVCHSCEKVIKAFKLGCDCYLEQKEHEHLYSRERCLNCAIGDYVRPLSKEDLRKKYKEYCQTWQIWKEIQAEKTIKQSYQYDGESYWAECSFCEEEIQGQRTHQEALSRNKVSFWSGNLVDERVICNGCLREKRVIKELGIKGVKKQMLYNYRLRGIV